MTHTIKDRIALPPDGRAEDQHDLPLLHRGLRLPRLQVGRRTAKAAARRTRTRSASTSASRCRRWPIMMTRR